MINSSMSSKSLQEQVTYQEEQIRNLKLSVLRLEQYIRLLEKRLTSTSVRTRQATADVARIQTKLFKGQ